MIGKSPLWISAGASACLALLSAVPVHAQQFTEVQVSSAVFGDIEFDSARDGAYCPSCNFGQGNSRFNWTDRKGNLWLGHIDWSSGAFTPANGKAELVDNNAAFWKTFGNGPEWAFSQQGSQLIYTRYAPGMPRTTANAGAAVASMMDGVWTADFLPGGGSADLPLASQWLPDPVALVSFKTLAAPSQVVWEPLNAMAATPGVVPIDCLGISARWVPGTHALLCLGTPPQQGNRKAHQQVFWYDTDSQILQQLTTDATSKLDAFMFQAPEFNNAWVFFTVANSREIDVYEQTGFNSAGAPTFQILNRIISADPSQPYIASPEPFINCSPTCKTYIGMEISAAANLQSGRVPSGLAVTNIDPAAPMFTLLTDANSPQRVRSDPEYFISANGPYLYYGRSTLATSTAAAKGEGEFYIDMQLGPPTGPGGTAE